MNKYVAIIEHLGIEGVPFITATIVSAESVPEAKVYLKENLPVYTRIASIRGLDPESFSILSGEATI